MSCGDCFWGPTRAVVKRILCWGLAAIGGDDREHGVGCFWVDFSRYYRRIRVGFPWVAAKWIAFLMFLVFLIAVFGSARKEESMYWLYTVVSSLFISMLATYLVVFFGLDTFQEYVRDVESRKKSWEACKFWGLWDRDIRKVTICYGGTLGEWLDDKVSKSSLATVYSIERLKDFFRNHLDGSVQVGVHAFGENCSRLLPANALDGDLIVLGGYISIKPLKDIHKKFRFYQNFDDENDRILVANGDIRSNKVDGMITSDVCLVTVVDAGSGRRLYWFSGNYGLGTYGAISALTGGWPEFKVIDLPPGGYVQYVIETLSIVNQELTSEHSLFGCLDRLFTYLPGDSSVRTILEKFVEHGGR